MMYVSLNFSFFFSASYRDAWNNNFSFFKRHSFYFSMIFCTGTINFAINRGNYLIVRITHTLKLRRKMIKFLINSTTNKLLQKIREAQRKAVNQRKKIKPKTRMPSYLSSRIRLSSVIMIKRRTNNLVSYNIKTPKMMMSSSRSGNNNKLFITKITMTTQGTISRAIAIEIEEPDSQMDKPITNLQDIKIMSLLRLKVSFKMIKTATITTQISRINMT